MKTAIIGGGISGMGAAFLLDPHHEITLYEQNAYIGGHTRTKTIRYNDHDIAVDTGFIVYNYRNYPHLSRLFQMLEVPVVKSSMSFAATISDGAVEWGARNLNAVFGQRRNLIRPQFHQMLRDIFAFNKAALTILKQPNDDLTLGQLLDDLEMSEWFRQYYLLPMAGAIWSSSVKTMLEFPARTFVQFFHNHGLLTTNDQPQWYTVVGGAQEYVRRLLLRIRGEVRANSPVVRVTRNEKAKTITVTDAKGRSDTYDQVVFACHADEALAMLGQDATKEERSLLGSFPYQENLAYLHRDPSQMPKRRNCWASWVYQSDGNVERPEIGITYWMNSLQPIDKAMPLFVTLNPLKPIRDELVFDTHRFTHPVFTPAGINAQSEIQKIQGQNKTYFCGAYLRYGFHEDGLHSAVEVAKKIGVPIPWEHMPHGEQIAP